VGLVCAATPVSDTAYVAGGDSCAWTDIYSNAVGAVIQPPLTSIAVVKEQDPASPGIGDAVTYRIIVANVGTATVTDRIVVDTISNVIVNETTDQPAGLSVTGPTDVTGGTRYEWSASGPLLMVPGTVWTFTIMGTVGVVCAQTIVTDTAFISAGTACSATSMFTNRVEFTVDAPVLLFTAVKI